MPIAIDDGGYFAGHYVEVWKRRFEDEEKLELRRRRKIVSFYLSLLETEDLRAGELMRKSMREEDKP